MSFFKSTQHQVEDNHSVQDKSNYVPQHPLLQQYNARELVYGSENEYSSEDYSSDDDYGYYSEGFIPSEYISSSDDEYGYYSDGHVPESFEVAEGRRWNSAKGWAANTKYSAKEWGRSKKKWASGKKKDAGNYADRKTKPAREWASSKKAAASKQYRKGEKKYKKVLGNRAGRQRSGMKSIMGGKRFSSRLNMCFGKKGCGGRKRQRQKKRNFERRRRKEKEIEKRARKKRAKEEMKMIGRMSRLSKMARKKEEQKYQDDMEKYEKGMKKHNRLSKARLFARSGKHEEEEGENNDSNESHPSGGHAKTHKLLESHLSLGGHAKTHKLLESHLSLGTHTKKRHSDRPLEEAYEMPSEWSDQTIKQLFEILEKFKKHKHSGSTEEKDGHKKPKVKKSGLGKIADALGSKIPKKPKKPEYSKPVPKPVPKHSCLGESKIKKGAPIYI